MQYFFRILNEAHIHPIWRQKNQFHSICTVWRQEKCIISFDVNQIMFTVLKWTFSTQFLHLYVINPGKLFPIYIGYYLLDWQNAVHILTEHYFLCSMAHVSKLTERHWKCRDTVQSLILKYLIRAEKVVGNIVRCLYKCHLNSFRFRIRNGLNFWIIINNVMFTVELHVNKCQSARIVLLFAQRCHLIDEKVNVTEKRFVSAKNGLNWNCLLQ